MDKVLKDVRFLYVVHHTIIELVHNVLANNYCFYFCTHFFKRVSSIYFYWKFGHHFLIKKFVIHVEGKPHRSFRKRLLCYFYCCFYLRFLNKRLFPVNTHIFIFHDVAGVANRVNSTAF